MKTTSSHIRFFYSNKRSLIAEKNEILNSDESLEKYREILQINFALGVPLHVLQQDAFIYHDKILNYITKNGFKGMLLSDFVDSFLYIFATTSILKSSFYDELEPLVKWNTYKLLKKDDLYFYNICYLLIFKSIGNKEELIEVQKFIRDNKENLGYLYDEFNAIENQNLDVIYELLTQHIRTSNRMKNLYKDNQNSNKTNGYVDFSALLIIFGKIQVWQKLGIELNNEKLNKIFLNEFGKEFSFFYF